MRYLPEQYTYTEKYTYTNEINGRSVYALSPAELYESLGANNSLGPKQGQLVYVRAFGPMPLIFVAPYSVALYTGNAQFTGGEMYSTQVAIELAIACHATVVFPLRTFYHPHLDPAVRTNPLLCTLSSVIENLGAGLVVEVHTREYTFDAWLRWNIYCDDDLQRSVLGFPRLVDTLQMKCAPTRVLRVTPKLRVDNPCLTGLLPLWVDNPCLTGLLPLWVRKTFLIPSLSLSIPMYQSTEGGSTHIADMSLREWEHDKANIAFALPQITYQTLLVKRERDRRGSISFEDELRLSGMPQSEPAPVNPFATAESYIFPSSQPVTAEPEKREENTEEILNRVFAESTNGQQ